MSFYKKRYFFKNILNKNINNVDVSEKLKCSVINCDNEKIEYNFFKTKIPICCYDHRKDDMINIYDNTCQEIGCDNLPEYSFIQDTCSLNCFLHKKNNMVKKKNRKCQTYGCTKWAYYCINGTDVTIKCTQHKTEDMIRIIGSKCKFENCSNYGKFKFKNSSDSFCFEHKTEGMEKKYLYRCSDDYCLNNAVYNYKNLIVKDELKTINGFCPEHRPINTVSIFSKICKSEWCLTIASSLKYKGYCLNCFIHIFPDNTISKNYKTREGSVVQFIQSKYPELSWVFDKKIKDGCSKRRPDIFLDLGYQIIIIEIDEDQHIEYDIECENRRIMEISQDIGHRPIIFIRFNPDSYIENGIEHKTCWNEIKNTISYEMINEWNERLNKLKSTIDFWVIPENKTDKTIELIKLFYNS
jgi:hypothetical protein